MSTYISRAEAHIAKKSQSNPDPCDSCDSCDSSDTARSIAVASFCDVASDFAIFSADDPLSYPTDALGPLAAAVSAIASGAQIDPAIVGQSVLATAALCTQHRADVETLTGRDPLSLYLLTVAESGDGKTLADRIALRAVKAREKERVRAWIDELKFWEDQKPSEREGDKPREVYIVSRDSTTEGIRRDFAEGQPSQGSFTSEAAAMLGGWAMAKDNRARTGGVFSALWDDGELSVSRGTAGRIQLYDRRMSLHWLVQPDGARDTLHDPLLSNLGFWPRFLVAWPLPAKPRTDSDFDPSMNRDIGSFWMRCTELLAVMPKDSCEGLPLVRMSKDARVMIGQYFCGMERLARIKGKRYHSIKPFAVRAAQQACRIAGVLATYRGDNEIDVELARCATRIATYSTEAWRYIFGLRDRREGDEDADTLLAWMNLQPGKESGVNAPDILHVGPGALRSRSRRDRALAILAQRGAIIQVNKKVFIR